MKKFTIAILGLLTVLLVPKGYAGDNDILVSGRKILVKDNVDISRRKVRFLSKDASFSIAGLDPTVSGATFHLVDPSPGQQTDEFNLPAARWTFKNGKYKYSDKDLVDGPVRKALLRAGRIRLVLNGSEIDFEVLGVAPLVEVGGVLTLPGAPEVRICFLFPGDDGKVKKDDPVKGIYRAIKAEAPDFCPVLS